MCKKRKIHSYCKTGRRSSDRAEAALKTPKTRKRGLFHSPIFRITYIIRKDNNQKIRPSSLFPLLVLRSQRV